jgi:GNAT superfamily N-acetyltransferase
MTGRIATHKEDPHSELAAKFLAAILTELARRYPDREDNEADSFSPDDVTVPRSAFIIGTLEGKPVGCGALRPWDEETVEIKRMFVEERARGSGVAAAILRELERLAFDFGYKRMILETGVRQPEAIALYTRHGFQKIEPFGEYVGNSLSVCYAKPTGQIFHSGTLPHIKPQ